MLEIIGSDGNVVRPFRPQIMRELPVDKSYLEIINDGLRAGMLVGNTNNGTSFVGTSYDSEVPDLRIAGKTGTAQFGIPDEKGDMPTHGWFTAFSPREDPQIVVTAYIEKGGGRIVARCSERQRLTSAWIGNGPLGCATCGYLLPYCC